MPLCWRACGCKLFREFLGNCANPLAADVCPSGRLAIVRPGAGGGVAMWRKAPSHRVFATKTAVCSAVCKLPEAGRAPTTFRVLPRSLARRLHSRPRRSDGPVAGEPGELPNEHCAAHVVLSCRSTPPRRLPAPLPLRRCGSHRLRSGASRSALRRRGTSPSESVRRTHCGAGKVGLPCLTCNADCQQRVVNSRLGSAAAIKRSLLPPGDLATDSIARRDHQILAACERSPALPTTPDE